MKDLRHLIHSLHTVSRLHHRSIENALRGMKIHHSQHRMLVYLFHQKTPPTQKEIAERFDISPAAVATLLKKMEGEGYIARTVDESDTRINRIAITDKGRAVLEESRAQFDAVDAAMMKDFSEEELLTLERFLDKMKKNLGTPCETGDCKTGGCFTE